MGIALNGPAERQSAAVLLPLKDLFAALFFAFFGLQINPSELPPALTLAVGLALVTAATNHDRLVERQARRHRHPGPGARRHDADRPG